MRTYNIDVSLKFAVPARDSEEAFRCLRDGFKSGKYVPYDRECRFVEYGAEKQRRRYSDDERLLRDLADAVIRYDKITDKFIVMLEKALEKHGVDYESIKGYPRMHMARDERFCQVREILRIVKNDPDLLTC